MLIKRSWDAQFALCIFRARFTYFKIEPDSDKLGTIRIIINLETDRLVIRPWKIDDLPHYIAMSQDVGYNCFSPSGLFLTKTDDEAIAKIKNRMKLFDEYHVGKFLLFEKNNGSFIGTCIGDFFDLEGNREVELGYRIMSRTAITHAVRSARLKADLTQIQLAKKVGTSQSVIARLESGSDKRTPSIPF